MDAGDTFLFPGADDHLWMIISDPMQDADNVVIVLFVSWVAKYDQACVLQAGDHPFIKHATCVQYPGAKVVSISKLESLRQQGRLQPKAPLSAELLALIRNKAEGSNIPTRAYEILREQGYVP